MFDFVVSQNVFEEYFDSICDALKTHPDWILGVILLNRVTPDFLNKIEQISNASIHIINGVVTASDLEMLRDKNLAIQIVGYEGEKNVYTKINQRYLKGVLNTLPNHFKSVTVDSLTVKQLEEVEV